MPNWLQSQSAESVSHNWTFLFVRASTNALRCRILSGEEPYHRFISLSNCATRNHYQLNKREEASRWLGARRSWKRNRFAGPNAVGASSAPNKARTKRNECSTLAGWSLHPARSAHDIYCAPTNPSCNRGNRVEAGERVLNEKNLRFWVTVLKEATQRHQSTNRN